MAGKYATIIRESFFCTPQPLPLRTEVDLPRPFASFEGLLMHLPLVLTPVDDPFLPKIRIDRLPAEIGRGEQVAVRIADRWVSRRHCLIEVSDEGIVVCDLDSKHGTFVNQRRVERSVINDGDVLAIGLRNFVAQVGAEQPVLA